MNIYFAQSRPVGRGNRASSSLQPRDIFVLAAVLAAGCWLLPSLISIDGPPTPTQIPLLSSLAGGSQARQQPEPGLAPAALPRPANPLRGCPTTEDIEASPWARSCTLLSKVCVDQGEPLIQLCYAP